MDVRHKYLKLSLRFHPDKDPYNSELFKTINERYQAHDYNYIHDLYAKCFCSICNEVFTEEPLKCSQCGISYHLECAEKHSCLKSENTDDSDYDKMIKEILDSIYYARRIQRALITNENYIENRLNRLIDNGKGS